MRTAVFPGSFDPITMGHLNLIYRASRLFDRLIVVVGTNVSKQALFSIDERVKLIQENINHFRNVKVVAESGLTIDFMKKIHSRIIVRGIRNAGDLAYERAVAFMNHHLDHRIDTVFLMAEPQYECISSRILKETAHFGGDISQYVPGNVMRAIHAIRDQK